MTPILKFGSLFFLHQLFIYTITLLFDVDGLPIILSLFTALIQLSLICWAILYYRTKIGENTDFIEQFIIGLSISVIGMIVPFVSQYIREIPTVKTELFIIGIQGTAWSFFSCIQSSKYLQIFCFVEEED